MSRRNDPFANFNRDFNRTRLFMKIWFAFVLSIILLIGGTGAYIIYSVFTDPAGVGEFFGTIYNGFTSAAKNG